MKRLLIALVSISFMLAIGLPSAVSKTKPPKLPGDVEKTAVKSKAETGLIILESPIGKKAVKTDAPKPKTPKKVQNLGGQEGDPLRTKEATPVGPK